MISISEWANDTATGTATYRGHTIEFTFRPGAYTGDLVANASIQDIVVVCVTEWNVDCPLDAEHLAALPEGAVLAVFRELRNLATQADLGEASPSSETS